MKEYWIYILECENNSFYTGYTINLEKRYLAHLNGTGKCKYTRSFKPVRIAQCWKITGTKKLAMQLERQIKKLSRVDKEKLVKNPDLLLELTCPISLTSEASEKSGDFFTYDKQF